MQYICDSILIKGVESAPYKVQKYILKPGNLWGGCSEM